VQPSAARRGDSDLANVPAEGDAPGIATHREFVGERSLRQNRGIAQSVQSRQWRRGAEVPLPLHREELSRHDIIEIRDVDNQDAGLVVEPLYLAAQLTTGAASSGEDPVRHASGFRHVWVGDREFRFNGDKHRQIVEYLFNAWTKGEPSVSTAAMFADLEFETTSRLRDIFKGHKDWKALIEAKGGACRLRVAELLEEQRANAD